MRSRKLRFILLSLALAAVTAGLADGPGAKADIVTDWNATGTTATGSLNSLLQARALATAHGAMFDAMNAVERRYSPYLRDLAEAPAGASAEAAGAAAMHGVLVALLPAQKSVLDAALTASLAKIPDGAGKDEGRAFGTKVAEMFVAERNKDRMDAKAEHKPATGPGQWRPTPPANQPMVMPQAADVAPFTAPSFAFLKVKGPPALETAAYERDLDEVRRVGARYSTERTADQTAAAIYWSTHTPVPWEHAARAAAQKVAATPLENARMFALMNMAGADAYFAAWGIKRQINFWRPITAIREAAVNADPTWEPLLTTPAHPDYPSGHAIASGAMAQVVRKLAGTDEIGFSAQTTLPTGLLIRDWKSLSAAEKDCEGARIWAGIHFRTADEHGTELGHAIADQAIASLMQPRAR